MKTPPTGALLAVLVGSVVWFLVLAVAYDGRVGDADAEIAEWVAGSLPAPAEWAARPFSWLGGWIGITALCLAAGVFLVRRRAWLDLGFVLAVVLGSQLAVAILKDAFDRPRPDLAPVVPLPGSPGFPSGHAATGLATAGALAVLAAERLPSQRTRAWLWAATAALGIAVGLSRVALGVHFASDVLAGWLLGLAWLSACLLGRERLARTRGVQPGTQLPSPRGRARRQAARGAPGGDQGPARLGP
jgi:undecaprenyl-diphosphatase